MRVRPRISLVLTFSALLATFILAAAACAHPKPDTSQLSDQGLHDYKAAQVVKLVNDVTTSAIAANRAKVLSDEHEQIVLTVNKQVLDVIEANPQSFKDKAIATFKNARDALPAGVQAAIASYLDKVAGILNEVKR